MPQLYLRCYGTGEKKQWLVIKEVGGETHQEEVRKAAEATEKELREHDEKNEAGEAGIAPSTLTGLKTKKAASQAEDLVFRPFGGGNLNEALPSGATVTGVQAFIYGKAGKATTAKMFKIGMELGEAKTGAEALGASWEITATAEAWYNNIPSLTEAQLKSIRGATCLSLHLTNEIETALENKVFKAYIIVTYEEAPRAHVYYSQAVQRAGSW